MKTPEKYKKIILSEKDPGDIYRKSIVEMEKDRLNMDYGLTEVIVYATEVSYAINVLQNGKPKSWWNFADFKGDAGEKLWAHLDLFSALSVAFVGSGPYPVTAFQVRERYPSAKITCIDNHIVGYLLGKAVSVKTGMEISFVFDEATEVDYRPFNVVIIAAMVTEKKSLVQKILSLSEALVIVRGTVDFSHERLVEFSSTFEDDGSLSVTS